MQYEKITHSDLNGLKERCEIGRTLYASERG